MNEITLNTAAMPVLNGCDLCAADEGFFHSDRVLDFNVLIYVVEGEIYVTEGETDYSVKAGELLFLKSGIRHYGKRKIQKGTRWYFVHFYYDEKELPEFFADASPIEQYMPVEFSHKLPKHLEGLTGSDAERRIEELCRYFHSADTMKKWNINIRLSELLTELAFFRENGLRVTLSDRLCRFLEECIAEPFSSKSLEQKFFLSYKHMAAVFKKEKGVTMQQYHLQVKMNAACHRLRSGFDSVSEIGAGLGYSDVLYFSRVFKRSVGVSPTEYRKNAMTNARNY